MCAEVLKNKVTSVGVIGLGVMGSPISENIIKEGFTVNGYDIVPEKIDKLVANGGTAGSSAREVAEKSEVVITSLPSLAAFENVIRGEQGILSSGANAVDPEGNAGSFMAHPEGGTMGWSIGIILSRGIHFIVPVGLEKLVPSVKKGRRIMWTTYP
jgi:hypothetical protein